jgi:hypothetical protein
MGDMGNSYSISVGKPEGKSHLKYQSVECRILFKWIIKEECVA